MKRPTDCPKLRICTHNLKANQQQRLDFQRSKNILKIIQIDNKPESAQESLNISQVAES